jgi:GntR family transcriptional regulator
MFQIDLKNRKPIYEQVVDNFRRLITSGVLKPGERAPSVRDMAKELTCNPNTIQKAFRELETRGYFYTVPGQGSFISEPPSDGVEAKTESLFGEIEVLVRELEYLGVSRKDAAERIFK